MKSTKQQRDEAKQAVAAVPELTQRRAEVKERMDAVTARIESGELTRAALAPLSREWDEISRRLNYASNQARRVLIDTACQLFPDLKEERALLRRERKRFHQVIRDVKGALQTEQDNLNRHLRAIEESKAKHGASHDQYAEEIRPRILELHTEIHFLNGELKRWEAHKEELEKAIDANDERCLKQ